MISKAIQVVGLLGSIALISGCVGAPDSEGETGDRGALTDTVQEALGVTNLRLRSGNCHNDGVIIKDGSLFLLGAYVGDDVTGMSQPERSINGDVCHNTRVWQQAAAYMCEMNQGGSFAGSIPTFLEYVDAQPVQHPAGTTTVGLFPAYIDVTGPCATRSQKDYALVQIECCMGTPTPIRTVPLTP